MMACGLMVVLMAGTGGTAVDDGKWRMQNSLMVASEYDSNVLQYMSTGSTPDDFGSRFYLSHRSEWNRARATLQLGAKKYMDLSEQDALLGSGQLSVPLPWFGRTEIEPELGVKGKLQRDSIENFVSGKGGLTIRTLWTEALSSQVRVGMEQFSAADNDHDYYRWNGGVDFGYRIRGVRPSVRYSYGLVYYPDLSQSRLDHMHAIGSGVQLEGDGFVSLFYDYLLSDTTGGRFDSEGHRLSLVGGYEFRWKMLVQLLGSLNYRRFSAAGREAQEFERVVKTESEEELFNTLVFSLSQEISKELAMEFKVSRYSNEFSSSSDSYRRIVGALGVRARF